MGALIVIIYLLISLCVGIWSRYFREPQDMLRYYDNKKLSDYSMEKYADKVYEMFPKKLDRDEVVAASIIHDFGKILEYKVNMETGIIDYTEDFYSVWISHSQWGFTTCMNGGFPRIAKMIAAHHGRTDWGSMIDLDQKDLEPYVYALHHIDDLSAKFGKTTAADI